MREFVEKEVMLQEIALPRTRSDMVSFIKVKPYTFEWDAAGQIPRELFVSS